MDLVEKAERGNWKIVAKWAIFHPIGAIAAGFVAVMVFMFLQFADHPEQIADQLPEGES